MALSFSFRLPRRSGAKAGVHVRHAAASPRRLHCALRVLSSTLDVERWALGVFFLLSSAPASSRILDISPAPLARPRDASGRCIFEYVPPAAKRSVLELAERKQ